MNLADIAAVLLQFAIDARQMFLPGVNLGMYTGSIHFFLQNTTDFIAVGLLLESFLFHLAS